MRLHNKWIFVYKIRFFLLVYSLLFSAVISAQEEALSCPPQMQEQRLAQPVSVSGAGYLQGFANQLEGNAAYTAYTQSITGRREQLYISGDAGILQAFDAQTGVETFSFTPSVEFTEHDQLTEQNYTHAAAIGGAPVIAEVYDGFQWRTVLVGTHGAAGKGLFALDITAPDAITLLWELDVTAEAFTGLDVQLGYSVPQPTVARLHTGQWAVVVGNGYNASGADTGAAALYLLDVIDGSLIKSLLVQSDLAQANGLSSPRLADYDGDGIADYAYAGDLHGNLWRFDLLGDGATAATLDPPNQGSYGAKSGSNRHFKVSYAGKPLFTATDAASAARQPIIAAPSLVRHPSRTGYLVIIGTGQHIATHGQGTNITQVHSLYGIWDRYTKAQVTEAGTITHEQLAVQSITSATISIGQTAGKQREARIISNNPVEWHRGFDSTQPVEQRGWRMDFQASSQPDGEMLVDSMDTLGSMLLLQTRVPATDPCAADSSGWLYAINPVTGGRLLHHAFADQVADSGAVTAIKFGAQGDVSLRQDEQGFSVHATDDQELIAPPSESMGRQSWRMIAEP